MTLLQASQLKGDSFVFKPSNVFWTIGLGYRLCIYCDSTSGIVK